MVFRIEPTYRAPIAPLIAASTETRLDAPTCGVAMGSFPPAFWRLVSAITMCGTILNIGIWIMRLANFLETHELP